MNPKHTPPRSVRVPNKRWEAARIEAIRRGETISDAVNRFLEQYNAGHK